MSMFDETTPEAESPDTGHEEVEAVEAETQEETEEVQTEEETVSEEEHTEELYAGKYKSVEDLVKGYKNLEKSFHESRQQKPQREQPQQIYQEENEIQRDAVIRMLNDDPIGTINFFVGQATAPLQQERETQQLTRNFENITKEYRDIIKSDEDIKGLFDKVNEIAQEVGNPNLAKNPSARVLKMAAMELWGDSKATLYEKAKKAGRDEAEAARRAKVGLSAPAGAKPKDTPKTPEEMIADSIVSAGTRKGIFG